MARPGPSLPGAFDLLAGAGPQKLVDLRHRLQTVHEGQPGAPLLHAMVLLRLGREAEARISLDALRADAVAQLVARRWAGMDSAEAPEEPSDVSWGLARLYHLLAEESLCPAPLRDAAYQAALQALGSCGDPRLGELQEEAWACCGRDVLGDSGAASLSARGRDPCHRHCHHHRGRGASRAPSRTGAGGARCDPRAAWPPWPAPWKSASHPPPPSSATSAPLRGPASSVRRPRGPPSPFPRVARSHRR